MWFGTPFVGMAGRAVRAVATRCVCDRFAICGMASGAINITAMFYGKITVIVDGRLPVAIVMALLAASCSNKMIVGFTGRSDAVVAARAIANC